MGSCDGAGLLARATRQSREGRGRMQRPSHDAAEIVIPTGRNGFCCVVPCALMLALEAGATTAGVLLVRHLLRRRAAPRAVTCRCGLNGGADTIHRGGGGHRGGPRARHLLRSAAAARHRGRRRSAIPGRALPDDRRAGAPSRPAARRRDHLRGARRDAWRGAGLSGRGGGGAAPAGPTRETVPRVVPAPGCGVSAVVAPVGMVAIAARSMPCNDASISSSPRRDSGSVAARLGASVGSVPNRARRSTPRRSEW